MQELPRRINPIQNRINIYKFSELLHRTDEELSYNGYRNIYLDDSNLVRDNLDFIDKLISLKYAGFFSHDYSILKTIEERLQDKTKISLKLIDDFENKDRSYIDVPSFEKASLEIPLTYAFWVNADCDLIVSDKIHPLTLYPTSNTGLSPLKKDEIKRIKETIHRCNLLSIKIW